MDDERVRVIQFIEENRTSLEISTVVYEEEEFRMEDFDHFQFVQIINGESNQVSMGGPGSNLFRHLGIVQIDILGIPKQGTGLLRSAADQWRKLFRQQQLTTSTGDVITFNEASVRPAGRDNGRPRFIVSIPYYRDEIG